jgi:hypothetical protein
MNILIGLVCDKKRMGIYHLQQGGQRMKRRRLFINFLVIFVLGIALGSCGTADCVDDCNDRYLHCAADECEDAYEDCLLDCA